MKGLKFSLILSIISNVVINTTAFALNKNIPFLENEKGNSIIEENTYNSNDDKYYMIFVDNNFNKNENIINKRHDSNDYIDELIVEINNIIIGNKDTYQDSSKLEEFKNYSSSLRKRSETNTIDKDDNNHDYSSLAYEISSLKDRTIIYSYLSKEVADLIKELPNVVAVTPDRPLYLSSASMGVGSNQQLNEIKKETKWGNVAIREYADTHLSMISQGKYNDKLIGQYDNNYYYPISAGKDIDIFIMDTGFNFNHPEFDNKNERITKCLFTVENGIISESLDENKCGLPEYETYFLEEVGYHGRMVSDIAGGLVHGVANKANIYGIIPGAIDEDGSGLSNIFVALQYINEHLLRPHKAVFNFSLGAILNEFAEEDREILKYWESLFDEISNKGAVFVASVGNDGMEIIGEDTMYPCAFDNVICVGATDNMGDNELEKVYYELDLLNKEYASMDESKNTKDEIQYMKDKIQEKIKYRNELNNILDQYYLNKTILPEFYSLVYYSNYGEKVDIYAPGYATIEYQDKNGNNFNSLESGTSFSSPIVAGVVATIMSDHPDIEFNTETMRKYLLEIGQKNILSGIPENCSNVFINNGKHSVYSKDDQYYGCGLYSGNQSCSDDLFCNAEGFCVSKEEGEADITDDIEFTEEESKSENIEDEEEASISIESNKDSDSDSDNENKN